MDSTETDAWVRSYASGGSSIPGRLPPPRRKVWVPDALPDPDPPDGGLPLVSIRDLLDEPDEATPWAIDGLLPAGGVSALVAKPKVCKSTLARFAAHCIAAGEPFLGRDVTQGGAFVLSLEDQRAPVRMHFRAIGTPRDAPLWLFFGRAPDKALALLAEAVETHRPKLVVIDTGFRFVRVRDVADYAEVTAALDPLLALARESGTHIMILHHARKAGADDRGDVALGSQGFFGAVDTMAILTRRPDDDVRTISTIQRVGDDMAESEIELRSDGRVAMRGPIAEAGARRVREKVADFLGDSPGATLDDIKGAGIRWQDARGALRVMLSTGEIERTGGGRAGDPYRHHVRFPNDGNGTGHSGGRSPVPLPKGAEREKVPVPGTPRNPRNPRNPRDDYRSVSRGE